LARARERNPIGTHGIITQVVEHIPILSDGIHVAHKRQGQDLAAERARSYGLQKLLSKDGAITRVAELLPGSNLVAAAIHGMSGNRNEAIRALSLIESWEQATGPDGPFAKVAELVPGVDAVAFAVHVDSGHYAQALRSVTKTSWVNLEADVILLLVSCPSVPEIAASSLETTDLNIIPRHFSMLVGLSDLLTGLITVDRAGNQRVFATTKVDFSIRTRPGGAMELVRELCMCWVNDLVAMTVAGLMNRVPSMLGRIQEVLDETFYEMSQTGMIAHALCPKATPFPSNDFVEAIRWHFPKASIWRGPIKPPRTMRIRPKRNRRRVPEAAAAVTCLSCFGCCGLGLKIGGIACLVGLVAGASEYASLL